VSPRLRLTLLAAVPGLIIGTVGIFHPAELTAADAERWRNIHVVLLPLFPLLALAPWLLARRENRVAGWVGLLLGYTFAMFYTGLDLIAGAAAGVLKMAGSEDLAPIFAFGNGLAEVGVWAHLLAASLASALVLRSSGWRALPGAVLVIAASVSFMGSHVYWPEGVATMYALAVGWGLLAWMGDSPARRGARA
jgi:hypothetical protein